MWNTCLRSRGGGLLDGVQGTSFVSVHGSKLVLIEVYIGCTLVGLAVRYTGVSWMG